MQMCTVTSACATDVTPVVTSASRLVADTDGSPSCGNFKGNITVVQYDD